MKRQNRSGLGPRKARPMPYGRYLESLKHLGLHWPATLLLQAERTGLLRQEVGLFSTPFHMDISIQAKWLVRMRLARLARNSGFPPKGHDLIAPSGQPLLRGWFGSRWIEAAS